MYQILFFACLPIFLNRSYNRIINQLPYLVLAILIFDDLQFYFTHFLQRLYSFRWFHPLCHWTHLQQVIDALPHEAVVFGLEDRVEVIGLSRY